MTRRRPARKRSLIALLLLACLLGAGLLALQHKYPDLMVRQLSAEGRSAPVQTPINATSGVRSAASQPPPESRFAVIALRPLFTPSRRPPDQPESPAAAGPKGPPTDLLVTGIVTAGIDSVAIIEPVRPGPQAEPALVARVGDSVGGWTVEAIEPGLVVLARDGERHEMPLIAEDDPRRANAVRRPPRPNPPRTAPVQPQPQRQPQPQPQQPLQQPLKTTP